MYGCQRFNNPCGDDIMEAFFPPEPPHSKTWGPLQDGEDSLEWVEPGSRAASIVLPIFHNLCRELRNMKRALGTSGEPADFDSIRDYAKARLTCIADLIEEGSLHPRCAFRTGAADPLPCPGEETLRIGIFPIAGNPIHWMHLLCGLSAMSILGLDKVVYVIAGRDDRKPDLLPAPLRHEIARETLSLFSPLFGYSPISLDSGRDGESAAIDLMRLNAGRDIHAFYLAGTDHCRRIHPGTGRADTIGKLEILLGSERHSSLAKGSRFSVAFLIRRGAALQAPPSPLDLHFIPEGPLSCSSTAIRAAMAGGDPAALSSLPHGVYSFLRSRHLYGWWAAAAPREDALPLFPEAVPYQ